MYHQQALPSASLLPEATDADVCDLSSSSISEHVASPLCQDPETNTKSTKPQSRVGNFQPSVRYLNKLGIKVRDFAFESTLPPIPTYYLQKQQVQPSVNRPLRRQSTEPDDGSQPQSQGTNTFERRQTEPVMTPEQSIRMNSFGNLEDHNEPVIHSQHPREGSQPSSQASTKTSEIQRSTNFPVPVLSNTEERHILNPLRNSTRSTLKSGGSPQVAGLESLFHGQESQPNQTFSASGMFSISFPASPLTPLPSSPSSSTSVQVTPLSSQLSNTLRSNYEARTAETPRVLATTTRYFLRKRPSPSPSPSTTNPPRPTKQIRLFIHPESPLRVARKKSKAGSSSRPKTNQTEKTQIQTKASSFLPDRNTVVRKGKGNKKKD